MICSAFSVHDIPAGWGFTLQHIKPEDEKKIAAFQLNWLPCSDELKLTSYYPCLTILNQTSLMNSLCRDIPGPEN